LTASQARVLFHLLQSVHKSSVVNLVNVLPTSFK